MAELSHLYLVESELVQLRTLLSSNKQQRRPPKQQEQNLHYPECGGLAVERLHTVDSSQACSKRSSCGWAARLSGESPRADLAPTSTRS